MKISIITATWNSGATVRDTMESVLAQDYTDFEHLIIDGGSTDNTIDIVRELEPRYGGKLKWISERDRGLYDAMNKGIMMATGDVIGILNSDDFYTSTDILSTVADGIQQYDAVYADIHYVDPIDLTVTGTPLLFGSIPPLEDATRIHARPPIVLLPQVGIHTIRSV